MAFDFALMGKIPKATFALQIFISFALQNVIQENLVW